MNIFRNTMKNVRKHRHSKLVKTYKRRSFLVSDDEMVLKEIIVNKNE